MLDREIGSGSFARVWHATHRATQQQAAVKEINLEKLSKKLQESLASEVAVLKHTQHQNVVCLHDLIRVRGARRGAAPHDAVRLALACLCCCSTVITQTRSCLSKPERWQQLQLGRLAVC